MADKKHGESERGFLDKMLDYEELKNSSSLNMKGAKLKKAFGRAKLFEIRRIVRRIRQLSLKKGTEQQLAKNKRKINRLEKQLEFLKDTHFEAFEDALDNEDGFKNIRRDDSEDSEVKSLVMLKLLEIVQKSQKSDESQLKRNQRNNKQKTSDSCKENDNCDYILQDGSLESKERTQKNDFFDIENMSNSDSEASESKEQDSHPDDSMFISSFSSGKGKRDGKKEMKTEKKQKEISTEDFEFASDCEEIGNKPTLSMDSVFVGSLSSGRERIDGKRKVDGKRRREGKRNKMKEMKKKGNRLGQRQRREQWEKLYGRKANHLKKEKRKDEMNKKRRMDESNRKGNAKKKTANNAPALHPSWAASKSKRKQESIVAFQGKKITFDE